MFAIKQTGKNFQTGENRDVSTQFQVNKCQTVKWKSFVSETDARLDAQTLKRHFIHCL